jgi:glycosyltransferase involved in cell wall biosynthesis
VTIPSISVGLPVYNGERYLRVALDSILNQTLEDWELIICDNASTDGTHAICHEYAARDPRVRYFRNSTNIGGSRNFCQTFALSRGEYFKWLAVDDYCAPEFLDRCKRVLAASPEVVICTSKVKMIDEFGQFVENYEERQDMRHARASDRMMARANIDAMSNTVYGLMRAAVVRRTAVLGNYAGSDEIFLAEMSLYGHFAEVPEYLLFRRRHPEAFSWIVSVERFRAFYAPHKNTAGALKLRAWRHLYEYLRAITRAPLPTAERFRLLGYVFRLAWWSRATLGTELISLTRGHNKQ